MTTANKSGYQPSTKSAASLVVAVLAFIAVLIVCSVVFGDSKPTYDSDQTVFVGGELYGNFQLTHDTSDYAEAELVPYDSLWGPHARRTEVTINGHVYGNCVGTGGIKSSAYTVPKDTYTHVRCVYLRTAATP